VRSLEESCREVLAAEQLTTGDVTYVIAHQANKRILTRRRPLDIPPRSAG
jgi:3-oxoacyl-[acyl-carrier-protein] synthase-3